MSRPVLTFKDLPVLEKLARCRTAITAYAALPPEQRVNPPAAGLEADLAAAEAASLDYEHLRARLREARARRNQLVARLCDQTRRAGFGVSNAVQGDPAGLMQGGFRPPRPWKRLPPPGVPLNLRAVSKPGTGTVQLRWKSPQRRVVFAVEINRDPAHGGTWEQITFSTRAKLLVTDLEPGRQVGFRVKAHATGGMESPWTDPIIVWVG